MNYHATIEQIKLDGEIFKPVSGTDCQYYVSNLGRIWSAPGKSNVNKNGRILKPGNRGRGYHGVVLRKCSPKSVSVHRIVAKEFLPNPENRPAVNHKNGDKKDNRAENLEWATDSYNSLHAYGSGLKRVSKAMREAGSRTIKENGKKRRAFSEEVTKKIIAEFTGARGQIKTLAEKYKVHPVTISRLVKGETYAV